MAKARLIGGSALRARLENVREVGPAFASEWAVEAADEMRRTKPPSDRPESSRFTTKASATRAAVYGAYWWIFVDRGTKKHGPKRAKVLVFQKGDETIFTKFVKAIRRRPFISRAAQAALAGNTFSDMVIQAWNGRKIRGRKAFL